MKAQFAVLAVSEPSASFSTNYSVIALYLLNFLRRLVFANRFSLDTHDVIFPIGFCALNQYRRFVHTAKTKSQGHVSCG